MGWAKYHEDDVHIFQDRMHLMYGLEYFGAGTRYAETQASAFHCPFCKSVTDSATELNDHIWQEKGTDQFVFLNGCCLQSGTATTERVYSLKLYNYHTIPSSAYLIDGKKQKHVITVNPDRMEYDLLSLLHGEIFSELQIVITEYGNTFTIIQNLDISAVHIASILNNTYSSRRFDYQVSEDLLDENECLIYMKMMIHEGEDTSSFANRIEGLGFEAGKAYDEIYLYLCLDQQKYCADPRRKSSIERNDWAVLCAILYGKYAEAERLLKNPCGKTATNALRMTLGLLQHDALSIKYQRDKHKPYGLMGMLTSILSAYADCREKKLSNIAEIIQELSLFDKYPLIRAITNLHRVYMHSGKLSSDDYALLMNLSPIVTNIYCQGISDKSIRDRIYRSALEQFPDSVLLKKNVFDHDHLWLMHRLHVNDGTNYQKALMRENKKRAHPFSAKFINSLPLDDHIEIINLGGGQRIGASCFVVSFHGHNVVLDVGIDPNKEGDNAYPELDSFNGDVDAILISHAHIDHCGGVPKAHAMWRNALILSTAPTKVLAKYLFSDMANINNGISNDSETENILIEKEAMEDTLRSMTVVRYENWFTIAKGIEARFHPAGHIIGAAMIELVIDGKKILYTGDFSDFGQSLVSDMSYSLIPQDVDYLITEAAYVTRQSVNWGNQCDKLREAILDALHENKAVLLPAASVGRSQELMCLIGEMALRREIPCGIRLFLGGMAIPTTTQISPFLNERYQQALSVFEEFDGLEYPGERSVTIASSGVMSHGSASNKIAKHLLDKGIPHVVLLSGIADEETENESGFRYSHTMQRYSLATHADRSGIDRLIDHTMPKMLSFVHAGGEIDEMVDSCKKRFMNDIGIIHLEHEQRTKIFDLLHLVEENRV